MKPAYDSASEESEDDAPEAVSLSQSKKTVREQTSALQQAQTAEKEKKRTKNRERDRKLKEQAASKKGKQVAIEEEQDESDDDEDAVMARMRKAMREAEAESDEDMDDGGSVIDDDDDAMLDDESDDDEEEFHGFDAPERKTQNPNHLPDHLFTSAFASQSKPALAKGKSKAQQHKEKQKAKKRFRTKPKDVIVGSRVVRSLKDNTTPTGTSAMVPTAKVRKFLDRSLALRPNGNARKRGWERRPASVGSLRTSGPAARFVRS
ncbi:hypothetical protein BDZ89DRAFT_1156952 [Hymenopellis radicata]|nr:hypothetical protein BDZ89DRAFT_1156952 [Hymenopellis radicata]